MNKLIKKGLPLISCALLLGLHTSLIYAEEAKKEDTIVADTNKVAKLSKEEKAKRDESRSPIGCRDVGYEQSLKVLTLFPGKEGALQTMYFFYNKLPQTVSLYQMRDKNSELSTRYNHSIKPNSWAVLATGEPLVRYICSLGEGKDGYGKVVDCADTIKVCEYVNVKFGLNNKGNFWIVDSNSRNGAVSEVVHYGIIPGV